MIDWETVALHMLEAFFRGCVTAVLLIILIESFRASKRSKSPAREVKRGK